MSCSRFLILACLLALSEIANAQEVFSKFPEEGTWVEYALTVKMTNVEADMSEALLISSLTVRSLESEKLDDKSYRWIEIETKDRFSGAGPKNLNTRIFKLLVAEDALANGKVTTKEIKKMWHYLKTPDDESVEQLDLESDFAVNAIATFWPQKTENATAIGDKTIESNLGQIECKGVRFFNVKQTSDADKGEAADEDSRKSAGQSEQKKKNEQAIPDDAKEMFTVYSSDEAPLGMVKCVIVHKRPVEGMPVLNSEIVLWKKGTGAKSALPDKK